MEREAYRAFTAELTARLAGHEDVLGLVAVGSMAERDYLPDEWSDHDFYVIVRSGAQDWFRCHQDWLPDHDEMVWAFPETEHGVKVLYQNGHLLEYAIFDEQELGLAKTNRYRVLLNRGGIEERMARIAQETETWAAGSADAFHAGQFLTNLLVGMGRYRRGEVQSAHQFVKGRAVQHLVTLLSRHVPSDKAELADNIDPTRRFEAVYPELGRELAALMLREIPEAARGMLTVFKRELSAEALGVPREASTVITDQIGHD